MLWFIIGCFIGATIGFFVAALCAVSSRASREEDVYRGRPTITDKDIQGWAGEIQYSVQTFEDWECIEDIMKEMLTEIGVSICPEKSTALDKEET